VVIVTHDCAEQAVRHALAAMETLEAVRGAPLIMPILGNEE
jgi:hypothetical protein